MNLTKDLNKNISNIQYNCLNLPGVVTFVDRGTITYMYAADGTKLKVMHKNAPIDDNTDNYGAQYEQRLIDLGLPLGKSIVGNLGQSLFPQPSMSKKQSINGNIQIVINGKGLLNHRTVGLAHEFGHVILFLRNRPFGHTQPGVNNFVYKQRADIMSKRLGYDY